jgi:signal transduction histidine kinase
LKNLLEWSRLQRGMMACEPETNPLLNMVVQNMENLGPHAERKQITLTHNVAHEIEVYADPKMLNGIVRNLLSNAVKFTETGGTVDVLATLHEDTVDIIFSDTGIGMDQTLLENLFRIDAKTSRGGTAGEESTGLGLILCKRLSGKYYH